MPLIIRGRRATCVYSQNRGVEAVCRKATVQRQKYASDLGLFPLYDAVEPVRHVGLVF